MLRNVARQSPLTYCCSAVNSRPLLPLSLRRHCSSKREPIEMEFDFSSPNELKKMEETIQKLIVHKATPDWLPFIPGASFWVPPSHGGSKKVVDLIDKLSHRLSKEEEPSVTIDQDAVSTDGIPNLNVELKSTEQEDGGVIEVVVYLDSRNTS